MKNVRRGISIIFLLVGAVLLASNGTSLATAQDTAPPPNDSGPLHAELHAVQPLYTPDAPLRLRFTLINTSNEQIAIPLAGPIAAGAGVSLPLELAMGTPEHPRLTISRNDESAQVIAAPATSTGDGIPTLRLAPHGTVGAEVDLRYYHQHLRYPGEYRVEWSPPGQSRALKVEFRVEPRKDAILVTDFGKVIFTLEYDDAPLNVANFLELVRDGFYDGKAFHRVIPGALIQGGCPNGDGTGMRPDGKTVKAEVNNTPIDTGVLAMAVKRSDPDSASSQFFIALTRIEEYDGKFTVIGRASDKESRRTLQRLSEIRVDADDRPIEPLTIRSINLVDTVQTRTHYLDVAPRNTSTPTHNAESGE